MRQKQSEGSGGDGGGLRGGKAAPGDARGGAAAGSGSVAGKKKGKGKEKLVRFNVIPLEPTTPPSFLGTKLLCLLIFAYL